MCKVAKQRKGDRRISASLLCYTRQPTDREEANNEDVALSMHLAVRSAISGAWEPLNADYGIFFAAGVPAPALSPQARLACTSSAAPTAGKSDMEGAFGRGPDTSGADAVIPGEDLDLKSLIDPFILRLPDGTFAVLATQVARGGQADGSEEDSFLLAHSSDLLTYRRLPSVRVVGATGVHRPRAALVYEGSSCAIYWDDDQGRLCMALVDNLLQTGQIAAMRILDAHDSANVNDPLPQSDLEVIQQGCGREDIRPGNIIRVDSSELEALAGRFGRTYNTSVRAGEVTVHLNGGSGKSRLRAARQAMDRIASAPALLEYSDGSQATRQVDWDPDQLAELGRGMANGSLCAGDHISIRGRVRQTIYPVPFARQRADPSIFRWSWRGKPLCMFIATEDQDGNCVDPRAGRTHMPLRVASDIAGLSDEAGGREHEIDLLRKGDRNSEGRVMTGCFWAPEIHVIGGRLSILFMPCFDGEAVNPDGSLNDRTGLPDMWTGCCHIMQLRKDEAGEDLDPRLPDNWTRPSPILRADGGPLNPVQRISLDMTVLEDSGTWYYAWQQLGSVWIATFDPSRPERLSGEPRQIIVPEFAWDNMIAEGPNALVHDGRIFMIYSGSLVGIDYTTGLVTAPAGVGADLTNPQVWSKLDYPLQKSGLYNGQWQLGTGHGMWSEDEDGNMLYVFHNAELEGGRYLGRDAQVRRVHWSADGMPILDMQTDEELDPTRALVSLEVNVV